MGFLCVPIKACETDPICGARVTGWGGGYSFLPSPGTLTFSLSLGLEDITEIPSLLNIFILVNSHGRSQALWSLRTVYQGHARNGIP